MTQTLKTKKSQANLPMLIIVLSIAFFGLLFVVKATFENKLTPTTNRWSSLTVDSVLSLAQETLNRAFVLKNEHMGIRIGTSSDSLLYIRGKSSTPAQVIRQDESGLIVKWSYPDGYYILRRLESGGVTCYRVAEMTAHENP